MKIHVEVWLAAALLHKAGHPAFSPSRLAEEVERQFGDTRPGVMTHISAHANASSPKNAQVVYNYLIRMETGLYRLYRSGDFVHPSRSGFPFYPQQADVPQEYWALWREGALLAQPTATHGATL